MGDTNGTLTPSVAARRTREAVQAVMDRVGVNVTMADVEAELTPLGLTCTPFQFEQNYGRLFRTGKRKSRAAPVMPGVTPLPPDAPDLAAVPARKAAVEERADWDRLVEFSRFAAAVNTVGGVERARAYLDVIEAMRRCGA